MDDPARAQRLAALTEANRRRSLCARMRRGLYALPREESRRALALFIERDPVWLRTKRLGPVLRYTWRGGRVFVTFCEQQTGLSRHAVLGTLSTRQRRLLVEFLRTQVNDKWPL